jgi:uncharacterized protein (TIGR02265 family)
MVFESALDFVGAYCDLEKRLVDIPPAARARGIWVRTFEAEIDKVGQLERYLRIFPSRASTLGWLPCSEAVARVAVCGALYASPSDVHAGMRRIGQVQPLRFSESLLGRSLIRLLSPDPVRVLQQGAAARRQTCNYGQWDYDFSQPRRATVRHRDEYGWLESQVLGSAEGTLQAIGVNATVELTLEDAYNGVVDIRW